jgi:uncharacterized protein (TIGR00661 family)
MKILYAIQGTGNGHLTRALELVPEFRSMPDVKVDVLISGNQHEVSRNFSAAFRIKGLSFVFGTRGGIDYRRTLGSFGLPGFLREVGKLPVKDYDFVINDFEPVSAWAARLRGVPCIGLSNQVAMADFLSRHPQSGQRASLHFLNYFAPFDAGVGFHFESFGANIYTPVIRQLVREIVPVNSGHYCVYLPSYSDLRILQALRHHKSVKWEVFSKRAERTEHYGHVSIHPVDDYSFTEKFASCKGVVCNAGFGTTSEALYLGKKLLVVPMKRQMEQQFNAAALKRIGVQCIPELSPQFAAHISSWIKSNTSVSVNYPDHKHDVACAVIDRYRKLLSPAPPEQSARSWTPAGNPWVFRYLEDSGE